jgi:hypothetical protein
VESIGFWKCTQLAPFYQTSLDSAKTGIEVKLPYSMLTIVLFVTNTLLELRPSYQDTPHYLLGPRKSSTIFGYMYDSILLKIIFVIYLLLFIQLHHPL